MTHPGTPFAPTLGMGAVPALTRCAERNPSSRSSSSPAPSMSANVTTPGSNRENTRHAARSSGSRASYTEARTDSTVPSWRALRRRGTGARPARSPARCSEGAVRGRARRNAAASSTPRAWPSRCFRRSAAGPGGTSRDLLVQLLGLGRAQQPEGEALEPRASAVGLPRRQQEPTVGRRQRTGRRGAAPSLDVVQDHQHLAGSVRNRREEGADQRVRFAHGAQQPGQLHPPGPKVRVFGVQPVDAASEPSFFRQVVHQPGCQLRLSDPGQPLDARPDRHVRATEQGLQALQFSATPGERGGGVWSPVHPAARTARSERVLREVVCRGARPHRARRGVDVVRDVGDLSVPGRQPRVVLFRTHGTTGPSASSGKRGPSPLRPFRPHPPSTSPHPSGARERLLRFPPLPGLRACSTACNSPACEVSTPAAGDSPRMAAASRTSSAARARESTGGDAVRLSTKSCATAPGPTAPTGALMLYWSPMACFSFGSHTLEAGVAV
jgi:hypothetical protein